MKRRDYPARLEAHMFGRFVLCALLTGCASERRPPPPVSVWAVTPVEVILAEPEEELDAEDAGPPPETVRAPEPPAYRRPRYIQRCRRDRWTGHPEAETVEVKDDARERARALARANELDEVLIFSRMAYGEEGTPTENNADGYAAMLSVIDFRRQFTREGMRVVRRPRPLSRIETMVAYSPRRVFPRPGDGQRAVHQQWLAEVELDGGRPFSWRKLIYRNPGHPRWQHYGCPRWLATVDEVRELFLRYPEDTGRGPCEERPHHWGGDMDDHSDDPRWRIIDCGATEDTFWVVEEVVDH